MTWARWALIVLFFAAAISLVYRFFPESPQLTLITNTVLPDSYATNVNALQMATDGLPSSRLQTPSLIHYQQDDAADFEQPVVTLYEIDQPSWQITANYGRSVNAAQTIYVWDNVKAHQAGDAKHLETTLTTSQATVYPHDKIIFTTQPVELIRPGLQVQSKGVRANIKDNEITLFSQAQAYYDPNTKPAAATSK